MKKRPDAAEQVKDIDAEVGGFFDPDNSTASEPQETKETTTKKETATKKKTGKKQTKKKAQTGEPAKKAAPAINCTFYLTKDESFALDDIVLHLKRKSGRGTSINRTAIIQAVVTALDKGGAKAWMAKIDTQEDLINELIERLK